MAWISKSATCSSWPRSPSVGSLTRAGDQLHLTQSALSHQLRDIESRLGAALFLRVGKRLVLTPAGERLLASAKRRPRAAGADRAGHPRMGRERAGVLRITTECYTCYHWLPPLLMRYRRTFPRVEVRIDVEATRAADRGAAGGPDRSRDRQHAGERSPARASRPLFDDELVLIAARDHRFAQQRTCGWPRCATRRSSSIRRRREPACCRRCCCRPAPSPARIEEVQLTEAITELVKAGLGVARRWRAGRCSRSSTPARSSRGRSRRAACTASGAR